MITNTILTLLNLAVGEALVLPAGAGSPAAS